MFFLTGDRDLEIQVVAKVAETFAIRCADRNATQGSRRETIETLGEFRKGKAAETLRGISLRGVSLRRGRAGRFYLAIAPWQPDPAPAVQPKQCWPTMIWRLESAS